MAQLKLNVDVWNILKNDQLANLEAGDTLWQQIDPHIPCFRSPFETLTRAYLDREREDLVHEIVDRLASLLMIPAALPDATLLACVLLLDDNRAKLELYQRAQAVLQAKDEAYRYDASSHRFGRALLILLWTNWFAKRGDITNAIRGFARFCREKQTQGSTTRLRCFLPVQGVEDVHGLAWAAYATQVAIRSEGDPAWKAYWKQRAAYFCDLMNQVPIVTNDGVIARYGTDGALLMERSWNPDLQGATLIGAALGPAHPITPCYLTAQRFYQHQANVLINGHKAFDERVSMLCYSSFYESVQTFGPID